MTMLDDDHLASLLARAAEAFEVPVSGAADIVARAGRPAREPDGDGVEAEADGTGEPGTETPDPRRDGRVHRLVALAARHRVLSAAACIVAALAVAGTVGALVSTPTRPTLTSGLPRAAHAGPQVPAGVTTTVPRGLAGSGDTQFKANTPSSSATNGVPSGPEVTAPTAPSLPDAVGRSAKIEQTGTLGLRVGRGELASTMTKLAALAVGNGGFVASSQSQSGAGTGGTPYGTITLQVPVANFSAVLTQAQQLGRTTDLTTKATDVTGQYVDLQARISALEVSRQQYLTILAKATTVGDVLAVQEQLDTIQSQIEQLQGQLQVLTGETSYSTLTTTVSEGASPRPVPLPESGLVRAWHESIGGFVAGMEGVVRVAGPVLFALLCLAVVLLGGRALWRRYQRHNL